MATRICNNILVRYDICLTVLLFYHFVLEELHEGSYLKFSGCRSVKKIAGKSEE